MKHEISVTLQLFLFLFPILKYYFFQYAAERSYKKDDIVLPMFYQFPHTNDDFYSYYTSGLSTKKLSPNNVSLLMGQRHPSQKVFITTISIIFFLCLLHGPKTTHINITKNMQGMLYK